MYSINKKISYIIIDFNKINKYSDNNRQVEVTYNLGPFVSGTEKTSDDIWVIDFVMERGSSTGHLQMYPVPFSIFPYLDLNLSQGKLRLTR